MVVSAIIPVYNAELFLNKCVDSLILSKKQVSAEIILVNDGSIDNSLQICLDYQARYDFIKVVNTTNSGPSAARNKGLEIANGDYITFVDSDDFVEGDYFQKHMENIVKYKEVDIIIYGYYKTREYSKTANYTQANFDQIYCHQDVLNLLKNTHKYNFLLFPVNKLYKKALLLQRQIKFDEELRLGEDVIFNLNTFYYASQITFVKESIYNYYENPNSVTSQRYKPFLYEAMQLHFQKKLDFYKGQNELNNEFYFKDLALINLEKTFYSFLGNILADKSKSFIEEIKKIRDFELIKFGLLHTKINDLKSVKHKLVYALLKYRLFGLMQLIYK